VDTEISSDLVDEARPSDLTDAQYRLLLESVPSGVIIAEAPSGRILRGNASLQRILRCTATCDDPQPVWFDLSGRELAATEFPLARALGDETVAAVVLQAQCGDGSMIWARVSAAPIHGPSGKVIFAVATIDDVGAEHQARALFEQKVAADTAALQHARARVRALFEHSPLDSLVLQVDEAGCVTVEECNEAFCLTSGYGSTDLAGRLIAEAMAPNTAEQIAAGARLCLQQGGFDRHYSFTYPLGERTVRTYYRPLPDESVSPLSSSEQPSVRRVLVTQIDLTESRRVEMALRSPCGWRRSAS
jgi:PAS domain S-box-containing protein